MPEVHEKEKGNVLFTQAVRNGSDWDEEGKRLIHFRVNGEPVALKVARGTRLLDVLRNDLGLTGTKEGCGEGECGACTIICDGDAVHACLMLAEQAEGADILTIEGLAKDGKMDPVQKAFLDAGAIQCGFCTPGMIMSAKALLMKNPHPTAEEITDAMYGNICRCTGYVKIQKAVLLAAERIAASAAEEEVLQRRS